MMFSTRNFFSRYCDQAEIGHGLSVAIRTRRSSSYDVALLPALAAELELDPYDLLRKIGRISSTEIRQATKDSPAAADLAERYRSFSTTSYVEVKAPGGPFA